MTLVLHHSHSKDTQSKCVISGLNTITYTHAFDVFPDSELKCLAGT